MNGSNSTTVYLGILLLVSLILLAIVVWKLVNLQTFLLMDQRVENQNLRNQLRSPDLGSLERLQRITSQNQIQTQNTENPNPHSTFNLDDQINTPQGPAVQLPDGNIVLLSEIPPDLLAQGWTFDNEDNIDLEVTQDGSYVAGTGQ